MQPKKKILIVVGSASQNSSNQRIVENFINLTKESFTHTVFDNLSSVPHFNPELTFENSPSIVNEFRHQVIQSDGVVICTPEYIFSIPSRLKNILEWCVSTTVFSNKPIGIITASADGRQGHAELQLIMRTLMASFSSENTLLIQGVKGKIAREGGTLDEATKHALEIFIQRFKDLVSSCPTATGF